MNNEQLAMNNEQLVTDKPPELDEQEWQLASTAMALIKAGRGRNTASLAQQLGQRPFEMRDLLNRLSVLDLIFWIEDQPFLTMTGARCCRMIVLAARRPDGNLVRIGP